MYDLWFMILVLRLLTILFHDEILRTHHHAPATCGTSHWCRFLSGETKHFMHICRIMMETPSQWWHNMLWIDVYDIDKHCQAEWKESLQFVNFIPFCAKFHFLTFIRVCTSVFHVFISNSIFDFSLVLLSC